MAMLAIMIAAISCSKADHIQNVNNEYIKSISFGGRTIQKFFYDLSGKIVEDHGEFSFNRYLYENERLVKVETAYDEQAIYSSAVYAGKSELMTSANSKVNSYRLYKYDQQGRLQKIEHYFLMGEKFEFRSMNTFEYEGDHIVKENLHDDTERISQIHLYTYDEYGNITNNKYYSTISYTEPELISEISYKYDNYKNPFRIYSMLNSSALYVSVNNIIETSSILYIDVPGIEKYSVSRQNYLYNKNGYPVKLTTENNYEEYHY